MAGYAVAGITAPVGRINVIEDRHHHLRRRRTTAARSVRVICTKVPRPGLIQIDGDVLVGTRVGHEFTCFHERTRIASGASIDDVSRVH